MARVAPLITKSDIEIVKKAYQTTMLKGRTPNINSTFKSCGFTMTQTKAWLNSINGTINAHQILSRPDDQITLLYNSTVQEMQSRVSNGKIDDRGMIELLKLLSGFKDTAPVEVIVQQNNISIEDYLKDNNIVDV